MHNFSYLRVMSMGGHFFLQTWICMAMIFEPYLGCYGSILSPDLVCCSWDYGLSIKWSSILNRMSGTCSNFQFILLRTVISQEQNQQSCWNFYSIFVIIRNRQVKLFSVITQPWRHPGAILCFDVIIDIFISVYHKLTKFNTHKLQVIWQHTDNPCPRARHDAHVRARQNFNMLKITYKQFWARTRSFRAFQNFPSVRVRARVVRARSANEWQKFKIFTWFGFLIRQLTISIFCSHSWPFIRPCERVKV